MRRKVSTDKRKDVFVRDGGRCAYCGRLQTYDEFEVDHKTPLSPDNPDMEPGTNELDNLQVTCRSCNEDKAALTDDEYRAELSRRNTALPEEWPFSTWDDFWEAKQKEFRERREHNARFLAATESLETVMRRPLEQ